MGRVGPGWVGSRFFSFWWVGSGWVGSVSWCVGLDRVKQNGPMDNSDKQWPMPPGFWRHGVGLIILIHTYSDRTSQSLKPRECDTTSCCPSPELSSLSSISSFSCEHHTPVWLHFTVIISLLHFTLLAQKFKYMQFRIQTQCVQCATYSRLGECSKPRSAPTTAQYKEKKLMRI